MNVSELLAAAKALPPPEREDLCTRIADTLESPLTAEEQAWADTASRRLAELLDGRAKGGPADEVFTRARLRLGL